MEEILLKLSKEEIDWFLSEIKEGNTDIIESIKPLNDYEQLKIKEYVNKNSELFIEINSKDQFLELLRTKEQFDEYSTARYFDSIFIFPFYVTNSLRVRIGGKHFERGRGKFFERIYPDLRWEFLEYEYQIDEREVFIFSKKIKVLGVMAISKIRRDYSQIVNMFSSDDDIKILNELEQLRLTIVQDFMKVISNTNNRNISNFYKDLELDTNNQVVLIKNDFHQLLQINQKKIIELDKKILHQLLKVSNYINEKNKNIQNIFQSINDIKNPKEVKENIDLLKTQIHTYELLLFNSLSMLGGIISGNLLVFYEIYESFEKIGIFNSTWEMDVANKLAIANTKLDELLNSICKMEANIVSEISRLSYVTQSSFHDLNYSISNQLKEIESSIDFNTLLTGIQAYQMHKVNINTRSLKNLK